MIEKLQELVVNYLSENLLSEILGFGIISVLIVAFNFYKKSLKRYVKGFKYYLYLRTGLSTFILIVYYFLIKNLGYLINIKIIGSFYENLVLFYIVYELTRFLFQLADIRNKKLFKFVMFVAFVNVLIIALIDIANKFNIDIGKKYNLMIIFKGLSLIPISVIVYLLTTNLAKKVPSKYGTLKEFLIKYHLFINFIVIVLGFLWIVNIINLSRELLVGVSLAVIIFLFYI